MIRLLRTIYYKCYIRYLAARWIFQVNLGDKIWFNGKQYAVRNGVVSGMWLLAHNPELSVRREQCRKVRSLTNALGSYRSGVFFYTTSWLDIWVRQGIEPWCRHCHIWPTKSGRRR